VDAKYHPSYLTLLGIISEPTGKGIEESQGAKVAVLGLRREGDGKAAPEGADLRPAWRRLHMDPAKEGAGGGRFGVPEAEPMREWQRAGLQWLELGTNGDPIWVKPEQGSLASGLQWLPGPSEEGWRLRLVGDVLPPPGNFPTCVCICLELP
jgi:hypothetical protein